jgi:hypothetical protein
MKADFFIELYSVIHDKDVRGFDWFSANRFTGQMLVKYREDPRTIKAVTDFRLIKQHITNARRIRAMRRFSDRLKRFAEKPEVTLDTLDIEEASVHAEAKALLRKVSGIRELLEELDAEQFYGEEELWNALSALAETITEKLKQADKRLVG